MAARKNPTLALISNRPKTAAQRRRERRRRNAGIEFHREMRAKAQQDRDKFEKLADDPAIPPGMRQDFDSTRIFHQGKEHAHWESMVEPMREKARLYQKIQRIKARTNPHGPFVLVRDQQQLGGTYDSYQEALREAHRMLPDAKSYISIHDEGGDHPVAVKTLWKRDSFEASRRNPGWGYHLEAAIRYRRLAKGIEPTGSGFFSGAAHAHRQSAKESSDSPDRFVRRANPDRNPGRNPVDAVGFEIKKGQTVYPVEAVKGYYSGYGGRSEFGFELGMFGQVIDPDVPTVHGPRKSFVLVEFQSPVTGRTERASIYPENVKVLRPFRLRDKRRNPGTFRRPGDPRLWVAHSEGHDKIRAEQVIQELKREGWDAIKHRIPGTQDWTVYKFRRGIGRNPGRNPAVEVSASDRAKAAKIKGVRSEMLDDPDFWKTLSKYIEFHGCWPTTLEPRDIPQGKYLVNMGKALDVSYEPTESMKGSNKYGSSWLHEFNEGGNPDDKGKLPDRLCTGDGKSIITHGGKFGVKDWVRG